MNNEWTECNLPFGPVWSKDYKTPVDSFTFRGLNKPGTLIDTAMGKYLIGHINVLGGSCDDCMEFSVDTIIIRYKIISLED